MPADLFCRFFCQKSIARRRPKRWTWLLMLAYEAIADAPDSVDLFANAAKFFAQASDVVVYRTSEAIIAVSVLTLVYLMNLCGNVILLTSGIQSRGENSMRDSSEVCRGKASS